MTVNRQHRWSWAGLGLSLLLVAGLAPGAAAQQSDPPLEVRLGQSAEAYLQNPETVPVEDPIRLFITVENISGQEELVASQGVLEDLDLRLRFTAPDGTLITAINQQQEMQEGGTPPNPRVFYDSEGAPLGELDEVELLVPFDPTTNMGDLPVSLEMDARSAYPFPQPGLYSAVLVLSVRTYPDITFTDEAGNTFAPFTPVDFEGTVVSNRIFFTVIADADGDGACVPVQDVRLCPDEPRPDCDDSDPNVHPGVLADLDGDGVEDFEFRGNDRDDDCNVATLDAPAGPGGVLDVTVVRHTVGPGTHPGSTKKALPDLQVQAFDKAVGSCAQTIGVSWQHYADILATCTPVAGRATNEGGLATVPVPVGEYVVLAPFDPDPLTADDEIVMGVSAEVTAAGERVAKLLQAIVNGGGKLVPAKYKKQTGSELLIISPEYIEWSGTEALYPFVFDSVGDWAVTTAVSPPEGFVADAESLTEEVTTEVEAVQFTLTETGTLWADTGVCQTVTHEGSTTGHFSRVGVRLSRSLAQAKGLDVMGRPKEEGAAQQEERKRETWEEHLLHQAEVCEHQQDAGSDTPGQGKGGKKK